MLIWIWMTKVESVTKEELNFLNVSGVQLDMIIYDSKWICDDEVV